MTIAGYPVTGQVEVFGQTFPLADIPMMSDGTWKRLARENAVHNYIREHGHEPESAEEAVEWQRGWIDMLMTE